MPGVSPNIDWSVSVDLGEPYVRCWPRPSAQHRSSWPFQPMPHQEGHLLANTRLVRASKITLFTILLCIFLNSLFVTITTQREEWPQM